MKNHNLLQRFGYACSGLKTSWKSEKSLRLQMLAFLLVIILLLSKEPTAIWWALLLLACGGVLAVELINTAIEKLIDHLHPASHPTLKIVKDTLAGAVLVVSITALLVFTAFLFSIL